MYYRTPPGGVRMAALVFVPALLTSCVPSGPTYTLSGTVSGLTGSGLVLQANGGSTAVSSNGPVTIQSGYESGTAYIVTVKTQPTQPSQTCVVGNSTGAFSTESISNVTILCTTNKYTVAGTVSGLSESGVAGSTLELNDNGAGAFPITRNGTFTLATPVASGATYDVTVAKSPSNPVQTCSVTNGTGTVSSANITNVTVTCTTNTFSVGGTVTGLSGTGLIVKNGDDTVSVSAAGSFTFPTSVASGAPYAVSIMTQPTATPAQNCTFRNGSAAGQVANAAVTSVSIVCTNVARFLYVANSSTNTVSGYSINSNTGAITAIVGSPWTTGANPVSLAVDPNGKFLHIVDGDGTVSIYNISNGTGVLTAISGSPFPLGTTATDGIVIHPSNEFAYIYNNSSDAQTITSYSINPKTGALTLIPDGSSSGLGTSLVFGLSGQFAYALSDSAKFGYHIGVFGIDLTTGILTAPTDTSPPAYNFPSYLAVTPNGKFLFAAGPNSSLLAFGIDPDTGAITAASGSPFAGTSYPGVIQGLSLDPGGNFVYLSDCNCSSQANVTGNIVGFSFNSAASTVSAMPGSPFPSSGIFPGPLVFDPSGKFAYDGNAISNSISAYSVNASTGALTAISGSPFSIGPETGSQIVISLAVLQ